VDCRASQALAKSPALPIGGRSGGGLIFAWNGVPLSGYGTGMRAWRRSKRILSPHMNRRGGRRRADLKGDVRFDRPLGYGLKYACGFGDRCRGCTGREEEGLNRWMRNR
jgi:hypothetical protein